MFYGYFSSIYSWWYPPAPTVDAGVIETPVEGTEEESSINEAMAAAINDPPATPSTPLPIPLDDKKKQHKKNKHRIH